LTVTNDTAAQRTGDRFGEGDATAHVKLQRDELMSERSILCLKPALQLEERSNHVQQEGYQRDHSRRRYVILPRNQTV
jgi:hypothetical protein